MKRITAVILALVMCLSLSACGQTDAAKAAQKAISQIGTVTESSESAITDAENLFNHLTEEEKSSVKNSEQLVNARKTYETILEEKKLQSVTSLIDAIGSVSLTSEEAITAAENAYSELTFKEKQRISAAGNTLENAKAEYEKLIEQRNKEVLPSKLSGVWYDNSVDDILSLYAFKDNTIMCYIVNPGKGAAEAMSGTYLIQNNTINYRFDSVLSSNDISGTGKSTFTYENDTLTLYNADGSEMKRMSSTDLMTYVEQEKASANYRGIVLLCDLVSDYYPDSADVASAAEAREAAQTAYKTAGENALKQMNTMYDKVQQVTIYLSKSRPKYIDERCYIYPYFGVLDNGTTELHIELNYTDAQTDAGWIFFNSVIFNIDGENITKSFSNSQINRDNTSIVWETADYVASVTDIEILRKIASSSETIIRFQGSNYSYDHTVTAKEKTAITDVLTAYEYLSDSN